MKYFFVLAALFASCVSATSGEFTVYPDDLGFKRIVFVSQPSSKRARVTVVIHSGEYDLQGTAGQAHYLEHLVYLSVNDGKLPTSAEHGRHSNASTTGRYTSYWFDDTQENLEKLLFKAARIFSSPVVDENYAETEKQIIVHEWDARLGENPQLEIFQEKLTQLYDNQTFGRSVLGDRSAIPAFRVGDTRTIHAKHYVRCNASLIVSGDVDKAKVYRAIEQQFANVRQDEALCGSERINSKATDIRHLEEEIRSSEFVSEQLVF